MLYGILDLKNKLFLTTLPQISQKDMQESLQEAHKFKLWKGNLLKNGLKIHEIEEVYTRYRHNGEALFSLVLVDATTPEGDKNSTYLFY